MAVREQVFTQVCIPVAFWPISPQADYNIDIALQFQLCFADDVSISPWRRIWFPYFDELGYTCWEEVYEKAASGFVEVPNDE